MLGANVFVLKQLAAYTNITISFEVVRLPDAVFFNPDVNVQIAALFNMEYDCVLTSTCVGVEGATAVQK